MAPANEAFPTDPRNSPDQPPTRRWLVDFRVASELLPIEKLVYRDAVQDIEIHLRTARHMPVERELESYIPDDYPLAVQVILQGGDGRETAKQARSILRRFLDLLAFSTGTHYRITRTVRVVDWTPGLRMRHGFQFERFSNPNEPQPHLSQEIIDTVARLSVGRGPKPAVTLALDWWGHALSAMQPREQFQYFWLALEILAEYQKSSEPVPDRCARCRGPLHCPKCKEVSSHRPYPKQAIQALIRQHVTRQPDEIFELVEDARNRLVHGENPDQIARELGQTWQELADLLGRVVWTAMASTLANHGRPFFPKEDSLPLHFLEPTTYAHLELVLTLELSIGVAHKDPAHPQIEELADTGPKVTVHVRPADVAAREPTQEVDPPRSS